MKSKKCISLLMAVVLRLSLVACGSNMQTKSEPKGEIQTESSQTETEVETKLSIEEMIAQAEEVKVSAMNNDCMNNVAKAKQTYCNKVIKTSAYVYTVNEDHVVLACSKESGAQVCIAAYLSNEDIVNVESSSVITVVGTISTIENRDFNWGGMTVNYPHYVMDIAYLVEE